MIHELPKVYEHKPVEQRWYRFWEEKGYFHSEPNPNKKPYTIVIPPPNVTGALHLGHALNNTLQDILIRRKRMEGYETLWVPGTDHAGIATQAVVERRIWQEERKTRHDLGRTELVRRIWAWKDEYENRILSQLKQMGCSCDWARTRFTLDPICTRAVRHTFFRLFCEGLIYRGKRLVNWDTTLQTVVSDDEVFHETVPGHFWYFRYPVIDPRPGEPKYVTIATTRPETMLGDTAVAVHPFPARALEDAIVDVEKKLSKASGKERAELEAELADLRRRQRELLPELIRLRDMAADGRRVLLPLVNREIPLILDEWAKPEMGTGCVKITPAHDPNDYEVGRRHQLPMVNILNPDGTLNENAGPYCGQTILEARQNVVRDMEGLGLLEKVEDRLIDLAHSDRSKTPIEPMLTDQWFIAMKDLAQMAMDAVIDGRVKIIPARYAKGYLDWLAEKRDWPISRQLWWGHQIPIWYCQTATEEEIKRAFAGRDDVAWRWDSEGNQWLICVREGELSEDAIPGHKLRREEDVLDTWFSSALWPHSTLGWPDDTPEMRYYYPTSTLVTSRDIITLWVARMVLAGLHNVGEVPFREVYIHPKILDAYGEGMSKSKGNGVDPVDVMEKFGADALRFALAYLTTETQDIRMPVDFECPHCHKFMEQTRENRILPRLRCPHCGRDFATQWAEKPEDKALPRALVVSERFEVARNFCNKLWNAARFVLINLEGYQPARVEADQLQLEDRWILSRLASVTEQVNQALDEYRFGDAARILYEFSWDEFCSFYVEMVKTRLQNPALRPVAQRVLVWVLDNLMRLLHPMVPFVTEEVWQHLAQLAPERGLDEPRRAAESVMIAPWPTPDKRFFSRQVESQFRVFQEVLRAVRDIRSRQNIPPRQEIEFCVRCDEDTAALLNPMGMYFAAMAKARLKAAGPEVQGPPLAAQANLPGIEVYVDLAQLIDAEAEIRRKRQELARLEQMIDKKRQKLADRQFLEKAPAHVIEREQASLRQLEEQYAVAQAALGRLLVQVQNS
ncbi:MAG: valine--tRNA ligase [Thermoguttaceae bacterium]|nr:valine--tRNA ligase [Thermoguttaceae bacterium]MDW8078776.1 valine--tRNA ligase [Thermoguttaceae bacterium]